MIVRIEISNDAPLEITTAMMVAAVWLKLITPFLQKNHYLPLRILAVELFLAVPAMFPEVLVFAGLTVDATLWYPVVKPAGLDPEGPEGPAAVIFLLLVCFAIVFHPFNKIMICSSNAIILSVLSSDGTGDGEGAGAGSGSCSGITSLP